MSEVKQRSFKRTLVAIVVLAATIPVLALAGPAIHRISTGLRAFAERELQLKAKGAADSVTRDLERINDHMRAIVVDSDVRRAVKSVLFLERADRRLSLFLAENPLVATAHLVDQVGNVVTAMPESALTQALKEGIASHAKELAGKWSSLDKDNFAVIAADDMHINIVAPIEGMMGKNGGAIIIDIPLANVDKTLKTLLSESENQVVMLIAEGHPASGNESMISARAPISIAGAKDDVRLEVSLQEREEIRFAAVRATIVRLSVLVAFVVVALATCGAFLARNLLRPLSHLTAQASSLASGRYGEPPPSLPFGEFQGVADTMAKMGVEVEKHLAQERARMEAELNALRSQMSPHFLFNTLNAIGTTIELDPPRAAAMLEKLASLYRLTLSATREATSPLSDELAICSHYLDLEVLRFGKRLSYAINAPDAALGLRLPGLILQTLVENAVKHGIARAREGGRVEIDVRETQDRWRIAVLNSGAPLASGERAPATRATGVGLENTQKRLRLLYGEEATFSLSVTEGGLTEAAIVVPRLSQEGAAP